MEQINNYFEWFCRDDTEYFEVLREFLSVDCIGPNVFGVDIRVNKICGSLSKGFCIRFYLSFLICFHRKRDIS